MTTLPVRLSLVTKTSDNGYVTVCLAMRDEASDTPLLHVEMNAHEYALLLSSSIVVTEADVLLFDGKSQVGRRPVHGRHVPSAHDLRLPKPDSPNLTADMIFYGEAYREFHGWDTATWHYTNTDSWTLYLVRWVDTRVE